MTDDYLDGISRGEMPDELKTVFQRFRLPVFAAFLTALTGAFVGAYEEMRVRYARSVPLVILDQDLADWLDRHMLGILYESYEENSSDEIGDADLQAMR